MSRFPRLLVLASALLLPCVAQAVIVYGGDGTQNTTAPAAGSMAYGVPWERVGLVAMTPTFNATGVFLGSYGGKDWVLTAAHVGIHDFTLNGTKYSAVAGSALQLKTLGSYQADLLLYQIDTPLDWALLPIASSQPNVGANVAMIGNGYNRAAEPTTGFVKNSTWSATWSEGAQPATSYAWASGNTMRWGTNTVAGNDYVASSDDPGAWVTDCAYTSFDAAPGEAQGASGDSGGGVFSQNSVGTWEVAGVMIGISTYVGKESAAVTGNRTYYADLSAYRGQILAAIPEPSTVALWSGVGALCLALWWRRRR